MRRMHLSIFALILSTLLAATPAIGQQVIATVQTDVGPIAVGVNPTTNRIYVPNEAGSDVTIIDGLTLHPILVGVGEGPAAIAVNPVTNKIYIANQFDGTVTVIDGATNHTTTIPVGFLLFAMAVNPVTNKVYVVDFEGNSVVVIDGVTLQTTTVPVGMDPYAVAVNSATNKVYVANYCGTDPNCAAAGTVTVINGSTLQTASVTVGAGPDAIAVNQQTNHIFVANQNDATVTVINGSTDQTATVHVGNGPDAIAVNPVTNLIYAANQNDGTVTVINGSNYHTTTVSAGSDPAAMSVDAITNKIYVVNTAVGKVTVIDGNTNNTTTIAVGNGPQAIGVDPVTNRMFVPNIDDNTVSVIAGATAAAAQFTAVTPCRLVDTRTTHHPIQGGTSQSFVVPQLGGCGIPTNAASYSLNVTVVPHGPLGYLSIWPTAEDQPLVSTLNSGDGRVKANAAIVPAGYQGAVSVYATDTTDLILDVDGYFAPPSSQTYQFYPLTPCRVADTRDGSKPHGLGPPAMQQHQTRDFPILSSPCLSGITDPQAYSFNVTVVPNPQHQPLNYLTVWPSNESQPVVSTLNNPTATIVANAAIVPAAPNGDISVYVDDSTDVILDINGYFAAPGQGGLSMYPVEPCRVLDTRSVGSGQPFNGTLSPPVNVVGSACAPPSSARAYVFNATVVPSGSLGFLTLWPDGSNQPVVSTLNAADGFITYNMAIVPTTNGSIDAYAMGLTQLILDISGYFAP